jgi:hypothetical protein
MYRFDSSAGGKRPSIESADEHLRERLDDHLGLR